MIQTGSFKNIFYPALMVFLAIGLQIQVALFQSDDYLGLRLNLVDLALPFLGLFILGNVLLKKSFFPKFQIPYILLWLAALGFVLMAALAHSYFLYGAVSHWALINKTLGWPILCSYFLLGGWLAHNLKENHILIFMKAAIFFCLFISTLQFIENILFYMEWRETFYLPVYPASALMGNKNAYIFVFLTLLSLATISHDKVNHRAIYAFYFLLPFAFIFTGGRTTLFVIPLLIPFLWTLSRAAPWKKILLSLLIGCLSVFVFYNVKKTALHTFQPYNFEIFKMNINPLDEQKISSTNDAVLFEGDSIRLKILNTTLQMIKENPIFGSGLGSAKIAQEEQWGEFINIIDNSLLWLWAETGLIGMLLFLCFYLLCLKTLYTQRTNKKNTQTAQNLSKSVFVLLLIFGLMSLFHELLYTRFMWFFLGLAFASPLIRPASHQT